MRPTPLDRLRAARRVLGGLDVAGNRVHPSMFDPNVLSLAHGDGVRRPHRDAVAAGVLALLETERASLDDYMFLQRHEELEAAITADFVANGVPAEFARNVCVDSGTTRLFTAFLHAVSERGDVFGVPRSYYHPLPTWCEMFRVDLELIPTGSRADYKLTAADLDDWYRQHRGRRPSGLILLNPTQTGAVYSHAEMVDLAAAVRHAELTVLEDGVFAGTEFPGRQRVCHLAAVAPDLAGRVVTLKGSSKVHNLANIRVGWASGPPGLIRAMNDYKVATSITVPFVAQAMALAALRAPADYLTDNARECSERAQLITDLVAETDELARAAGDERLLTVVHQPRAGHAILVATPGLVGRRLPDGSTIHDSIDVTRFLLSAANVAVSPGYSMGFDGTEVRLAFGSVGLKHTYRPAAAGELRSALQRLGAMSARSQPEVARQLHEVSELLADTAPTPGLDLFQPGRDLIVTAFRERMGPAFRSLLSGPVDRLVRAP